MRLPDADVDSPQARLHINKPHHFIGNVQQQQRVAFGNGKVFAVARTPAQSFHERGPIVALASDVLIFPEPDAAVEKNH